MSENRKITVFKNIFERFDPFHSDIISIFRRIKNGDSKELIELIRKEKNKDIRQNLKKRLPSICFSGKFSQRGEKYLLEHSGFICLDVDGVTPEDMPKIRESIEADEFVMACFVSPSGNGYKIIIKSIPDKAEHKGVFLSLEEHFNKLLGRYNIDKSGKDVSRVCYESFDPRIYQNPDSEVWDQVLTEVKVEKTITEQSKIIELLKVWIDRKETYSEGNRNNYMTIFLHALNRYKVQEMTAKEYVSANFPGFPQNDLSAMAKSCYSNTADYGTQEFTESDFQKFAKNKKTNNIEVNATDKSICNFWNINDKGRVKIDTKRLLEYIKGEGFGVYRNKDSVKTWDFVRTQNMIVDLVDTIDIKTIVIDYVEKHAPEAVFDELQMRNRYFEKSFLNALPVIDVQQVKDTNDKCYIFFENHYFEITKDSKTKKDYLDLEGVHIWRKQICRKEVSEIVEEPEYQDFDFVKFLFNAMGKDVKKYKSACTVIGYSMHTYKKQRLSKLIYACDNSIGELDGLAMGGSGKNLFQQCLEYVRSVEYIDGKDFDKRDKFKFQNVNVDTQLVIIDDYEGDIKEMFTRITGHFAIEKKGLDKITLAFEDSPKLLISSNSAPKGYSDSYARRLKLIEFTDHYSAEHTPSDEFGDRDFFSEDWNQEDYNKLYSFLFDCVKLYLNEGLTATETSDLKTKQLIKNTSRQFFEFWTYSTEADLNNFQTARDLCEDYKTVMQDFDISEQGFYANCRQLCKLYGWRYVNKGAGVTRKIKFEGYSSLKE